MNQFYKSDLVSGNNYPSRAILENGRIINYWTCHSVRLELYDNQPDKFVYLGYGHIYEVGGVKQTIYPDVKYHFWGKLF